jgi:hypothetical protein
MYKTVRRCIRNSGQRDLAIETDARFTRNASHAPSVVVSQQDQR